MNNCKGYRTTRRDAEHIYETHWATLNDGTTVATLPDIEAPTPHFGKHRNGRPAMWTRVDALPTDAEFIGHYPAPTLRA